MRNAALFGTTEILISAAALIQPLSVRICDIPLSVLLEWLAVVLLFGAQTKETETYDHPRSR